MDRSEPQTLGAAIKPRRAALVERRDLCNPHFPDDPLDFAKDLNQSDGREFQSMRRLDAAARGSETDLPHSHILHRATWVQGTPDSVRHPFCQTRELAFSSEIFGSSIPLFKSRPEGLHYCFHLQNRTLNTL